MSAEEELRQQLRRLPAGDIRNVLLADTHYAALGVAVDASSVEIKKSFYKLALKLHPDKNQQPYAEEAFKRIEEAHRTLSDARERRTYDASVGILHSPPRQARREAYGARAHYKYQ